MRLLHLPCLIVPLDNTNTSAIPDPVPGDIRSNENAESSATADENKSSWRSTASATAKLLLRGVRDSADAFPPLKSVAGGLCFILDNCEVRPPPTHYPRRLQVFQRTKANNQLIESLAPRVEVLVELLCGPVSKADTKEGARRKRLAR